MSDLWGLRDELVNKYGLRYCSYDPPGTGWSDPVVAGYFSDKPSSHITKQVMDALGETGPFVMMGSMDNAFDRALAFSLEYPDVVAAVVPVTLLVDEFQVWRDFYGKTNDEMVA